LWAPTAGLLQGLTVLQQCVFSDITTYDNFVHLIEALIDL